MMKLNTIATVCLAVLGQMGFANAQDRTSTGAYPTPTSSSTSAPRTGLYTGVTKSNAAADNTVDDYSRRPTLIGDKQYLAGWGTANLVNAAYSIQGNGFDWFGSVLALDSLSQIRAGLASGTAWGAGVIFGVNRLHTKTATPSTETTTYYAPSGFGIFGDFNLGSSDVYGQIGWNTGVPSLGGLQNSVLTKPPSPAPKDDDQNHTLSFMAGWKKDATTEGTHAYNLEVGYSSEMRSLENPTFDETFNTISVMPAWGYILRANSSYAVFLGTNGLLSYLQPENGSAYTIALSPNFAFQKQFGKGFEGFSGFAVTASWDSQSDLPVDGAEASQLLTADADMAVGIRWVKDNFALEGSLKETVLANGPFVVGGNSGQGLLASIGISLGI
ncbi:MAG: hypothetical protein ABIW76_09150 [Fibrobacteria bacterium]